MEKKWPDFYVQKLKIPRDFILLVGWTGEPASTSALIKQMDSFKKKSPQEYARISKKIKNLVNSLIIEWERGKREKILDLLRKNEDYLRELGQESGVLIETPQLRKLSEIANKAGGAGKLSGSGGGDCGIALTFNKKIAKKIKREWKKNNILPIKAEIDFSGVKIH